MPGASPHGRVASVFLESHPRPGYNASMPCELFLVDAFAAETNCAESAFVFRAPLEPADQRLRGGEIGIARSGDRVELSGEARVVLRGTLDATCIAEAMTPRATEIEAGT